MCVIAVSCIFEEIEVTFVLLSEKNTLLSQTAENVSILKR